MSGRIVVETVGSALLLRDRRDTASLSGLAARLPAEPATTAVVCTPDVTRRRDLYRVLPGILAERLGGSAMGVRLFTFGVPDEAKLVAARVLALSAAIGGEVIAPAGRLVVGPSYTTAVSGRGASWLRCADGATVHEAAPWHPAPAWAASVPAGRWWGPAGTVVAIPAGLWIALGAGAPDVAAEAEAVSPDSDVCTLVTHDPAADPAVEEILARAPFPFRLVTLGPAEVTLGPGESVASGRRGMVAPAPDVTPPPVVATGGTRTARGDHASQPEEPDPSGETGHASDIEPRPLRHPSPLPAEVAALLGRPARAADPVPTPATRSPEAAPAPVGTALDAGPWTTVGRYTPADRNGLRAALAGGYDAHGRTVARLLAEQPGLRAAGQPADLVTGLVGLRAYLAGAGKAVNGHLRGTDRDAPAVAAVVGRCADYGLARMPPMIGTVYRAVTAEPSIVDGYRPGDGLVEPGFVDADTEPGQQPDRADRPYTAILAIFSISARDCGEGSRVLFPPGSRFRVVDVLRPGHAPPVVLLVDRAGEVQTAGDYLEWASGRLRADAAALPPRFAVYASPDAVGLDRAGARFNEPEGAT
ncbi:hypothetical protein [Dactylosporangium sp. CA-092794]|uniref:hypothetical protein n=1 Tax=Dactylosporangium sp. CA-092794 TaxID=3239929 RepID=UPI003D90E7C4